MMHLKQGDLFWGMNIDFVKTLTELAVHISCKKGDKLFAVGEPADYFYVLLKGNVTMDRGKAGHEWHTASHPGEIFGWSALIQNKEYAASATCGTDAELLKIERGPFLNELENNPKEKGIFFERLAAMLGNQLLGVYISIT